MQKTAGPEKFSFYLISRIDGVKARKNWFLSKSLEFVASVWYLCFFVSMFLCFFVPWSLCSDVSLFLCFMFLYSYVSLYLGFIVSTILCFCALLFLCLFASLFLCFFVSSVNTKTCVFQLSKILASTWCQVIFVFYSFSFNFQIRKVDNFPFLPRLKTLYFNNNRIVRIGEGLDQSMPSLETLILTNNNIQELADIEQLSCVKTLTMISFLHNPVSTFKLLKD